MPSRYLQMGDFSFLRFYVFYHTELRSSYGLVPRYCKHNYYEIHVNRVRN